MANEKNTQILRDMHMMHGVYVSRKIAYVCRASTEITLELRLICTVAKIQKQKLPQIKRKSRFQSSK